MKKGKIIVVSAPSGAGKSTLLDYVRCDMPDLVYSISATTRKPRPGEVDGAHYFFLSREEFTTRIGINEFAEWEEVHGNYYGTPRSFIDVALNAGKHVVMDIDVKGRIKFAAAYPDASGIFIMPPSLDELEKRLRSRATESEADLAVRLANARREIALARECGLYQHTIVNDSLPQAQAAMCQLIHEITG